MKKIIIFIAAILVVILVYKDNMSNNVKIPDTSIRFRVLANSNSPKDQKIKELVRDKLQEELYNSLKDTKTIDEARKKIKGEIPNYKKIIDNEIKDINYSYNIDYGLHEFPEKIYKGIKYDEGLYESLLVTLGEGKGDNWWCVLFPPLCLLEAEEHVDDSEIEYKSFVKELIRKYF